MSLDPRLTRTAVVYKPTSILNETTQLGFNGDPNDASNTGSVGEQTLYFSQPGVFYINNSGEMFVKNGSPNNWVQISQESVNTYVVDTSADLESLTGLAVGDKIVVRDNNNRYEVISTTDGTWANTITIELSSKNFITVQTEIDRNNLVGLEVGQFIYVSDTSTLYQVTQITDGSWFTSTVIDLT